MQENNFESIINTWRRLSGEQVESSALLSMAGDSHGSHIHKKEEDTDPLVPERPKIPVEALAGTAVVTSDIKPDEKHDFISEIKADEKQELIENNKELKEEEKEAHGDSNQNDEKKDSDYLEHNEGIEDKYPDANAKQSKWDKEKVGDNVDSVYLRPPPPHKVRSNTSNNDEEDCGVKCLYYTLQCCDCVLM